MLEIALCTNFRIKYGLGRSLGYQPQRLNGDEVSLSLCKPATPKREEGDKNDHLATVTLYISSPLSNSVFVRYPPATGPAGGTNGGKNQHAHPTIVYTL